MAEFAPPLRNHTRTAYITWRGVNRSGCL